MKQKDSHHCCNLKTCPRCRCPVDKLTLVCPRCREPIPGGCTGSCFKCNLAKAKH
ncbi:hypothetical protein [Desulforamulus hydrothermalis]|uniref:hypothetical protein n=1 Tax=Desulforamulus hydrothermalis TaxID=412895 RepID=UPI00031764A2|nr:hypothetical protein [Desulforamulus hydrothermalis]SHG69687.1 hypothetical protein SAMN02745177_00016 [Desulforamulus hydrothermalis Lam5 = DSM 18033]